MNRIEAMNSDNSILLIKPLPKFSILTFSALLTLVVKENRKIQIVVQIPLIAYSCDWRLNMEITDQCMHCEKFKRERYCFDTNLLVFINTFVSKGLLIS